jgi:hypothetical protein
MAEETIMECLQGYVGVTPDLCSQPTELTAEEVIAAEDETIETSGLFITELPGISLESIEKLATPEQKTFMGVWANVEKRALLKFRSAVLAELNKCYCISDVTVIDCIVCNNKTLFATALWYMLGSELCFERLFSNSINRFTTIDKKAAGEMRDTFLVDFQTELENAVKGIDVEDNECIDDVQKAGNIQYVDSPVC